MIEISLKVDKESPAWQWLKSQENKLISAGHIGTHIDVYNKSEVPESYMKTKGVLVDCTKYDLDEEIGMEVLKEKKIEEGNFVLFNTGIQNENPYGSDVYINRHHQLSFELIDYLLSKKVSFIGIDCAGVRRGKEHFEADIKCESNNTYVIENLDFSRLTDKSNDNFDVYTVWINNPLATGLHTRVFANYKGDN